MGRRRVTGTLSSVVFSVTILCIAASPTFAAPTYSITDLGTLGGAGSWAYGINDAGQVVGSSDLTGSSGRHAFLYSAGTMTDLTPTVNVSYGYGINNSGQVTGFAYNPSGLEEAFRYSAGTMDYLGALQPHTQGRGINDLGQVVGHSSVSASYPSPFHAFLYTDGTGMTDLGTLGGTSSTANGINNAGQVIGFSLLADNSQHAFLWSAGGGMKDLGSLSGSWSYALGINEAGLVVGASDDRAFLWSAGQGMRDLGSLGESWNYACDINETGQVVGASYGHAFLWEADTMYDLNDLVPTGSGWMLYDARGINETGQICGLGISPSGKDHAYLLTPISGPPSSVPEPSLAGLLLIATVPALVVYRKRRRT